MRNLFLAIGLGLTTIATAATPGRITYSLEKATSPTADQLDAYARIEKAMDSALGYYNTLTTIAKTIRVQYDASVPTADASSNGTLRFGSSRSYMVVITAMHEIAHTVGVGTTAEYRALVVNGVVTSPHATATLRQISGDSTAVLHGDTQHIWPYGLNFASEVKSTADLVRHCLLVASLYQDLFHETVAFEGRIRSQASGQCLSRDGSRLGLGVCSDSNSLVRLVAMGELSPTYRLEFGDLVLDAPNQATTAGLKLDLYTWNRGTNQQVRLEGGTPQAGAVLHLVMVPSNLSVEASGSNVLQNPTKASAATQTWELLAVGTASVRSRTTKRIPSNHPFPVDLLGRERRGPASWRSFP